MKPKISIRGAELISQLNSYIFPFTLKRLRWSRVQTRPKPNFSGEKFLTAPSFGGEVKSSVPCRSFAACKKSLKLPWKSQ
jgi:hypothetical protein